MEYAYTLDFLQETVSQNPMVLLFFTRQESVDSLQLLKRIDRLSQKYPKLVSLHVDLDQVPMAASRFAIYALPGVVVYVNGKPAINAVQNIDIGELLAHVAKFYREVFFPA